MYAQPSPSIHLLPLILVLAILQMSVRFNHVRTTTEVYSSFASAPFEGASQPSAPISPLTARSKAGWPSCLLNLRDAYPESRPYVRLLLVYVPVTL